MTWLALLRRFLALFRRAPLVCPACFEVNEPRAGQCAECFAPLGGIDSGRPILLRGNHWIGIQPTTGFLRASIHEAERAALAAQKLNATLDRTAGSLIWEIAEGTATNDWPPKHEPGKAPTLNPGTR